MAPAKIKLKNIAQPPISYLQFQECMEKVHEDDLEVDKAKSKLVQASAEYEGSKNLKKALPDLVDKSKKLARAVLKSVRGYTDLLTTQNQGIMAEIQRDTNDKIVSSNRYEVYEYASTICENYEIWRSLSSRMILFRENNRGLDVISGRILHSLFLVPELKDNSNKLNNVIKILRGVNKIRGELEPLTKSSLWGPLIDGVMEISSYKEEGSYVFEVDGKKYTTKNEANALTVAEMMADCNPKYKHVIDSFKSKQKFDVKKNEPSAKAREDQEEMKSKGNNNEPMNEEFDNNKPTNKEPGNREPMDEENMNPKDDSLNVSNESEIINDEGLPASQPDSDVISMEEENEDELDDMNEEDEENGINQELLVKALDKTRRAHDDLGTNQYENDQPKKKYEKLERNYGIRHALYKNALANGVYLPRITSNAITDYSMLMTGHPQFFMILVGDVDLSGKTFEKLRYPVWYCYEMFQRFLHNKFKQILPYEQTPNKEYVDTVLGAYDPNDTLELRCKPLNLTQIQEQTIILRKNKEVKVRDRQGFRISVKAFEKQYRFIEKTLARIVAYQCKIHDRKHEFQELRKKVEDFEKLHDFSNKFAWQSSELKHLFDVVKDYVVNGININDNVLEKIMGKFASKNTLEEVLELIKDSKSKPFSMYKSKVQKIIAPDEMTKEMANDINFEDIFEVYKEEGLSYFQERVGSYGQTPQQQQQFTNIKNKLEQKEQDRYEKLKMSIDEAITEAEKNRQYLGQFGIDAEMTLKQLRSFNTQLEEDKSSAMRRSIDVQFFKVYKKLQKAYSNGREYNQELVREDILHIKEMTKVQHQKKTVRLYKLEKTAEMAMSVKSKGEFGRRRHNKKKLHGIDLTTAAPMTQKKTEAEAKVPDNKMNIEEVQETIKERAKHITPENMQQAFKQHATRLAKGMPTERLDRDDSQSEV